MAALGCSAGGMLALRLLRAGLDLVAAVSPAPLDQRGWEQAQMVPLQGVSSPIFLKGLIGTPTGRCWYIEYCCFFVV